MLASRIPEELNLRTFELGVVSYRPDPAHFRSIAVYADSLAFISIDGLYRALNKGDRNPDRPQYCDACFTGEYPIPLPDMADNDSRQLSLLSESR